MTDYYCIWCGGYLYDELEKTGKHLFEILKNTGSCGRPWCPSKKVNQSRINL